MLRAALVSLCRPKLGAPPCAKMTSRRTSERENRFLTKVKIVLTGLKPKPGRRFTRDPAGIPLLEELQDHLRVLIGDGKRLHAKLLLCLQSLETGRGLVHICVNKRRNACRQRLGHRFDELVL